MYDAQFSSSGSSKTSPSQGFLQTSGLGLAGNESFGYSRSTSICQRGLSVVVEIGIR